MELSCSILKDSWQQFIEGSSTSSSPRVPPPQAIPPNPHQPPAERRQARNPAIKTFKGSTLPCDHSQTCHPLQINSPPSARWLRTFIYWVTRSSNCSSTCTAYSFSCFSPLAVLARSTVLIRLHTHSLPSLCKKECSEQ